MWETPPFQPVVKDGWLYGRGVGDMKSGTIAALYAQIRRCAGATARNATLRHAAEEAEF
jgi:acetylornithine deacetylase